MVNNTTIRSSLYLLYNEQDQTQIHIIVRNVQSVWKYNCGIRGG